LDLKKNSPDVVWLGGEKLPEIRPAPAMSRQGAQPCPIIVLRRSHEPNFGKFSHPASLTRKKDHGSSLSVRGCRRSIARGQESRSLLSSRILKALSKLVRHGRNTCTGLFWCLRVSRKKKFFVEPLCRPCPFHTCVRRKPTLRRRRTFRDEAPGGILFTLREPTRGDIYFRGDSASSHINQKKKNAKNRWRRS